MKSLIKCLVLIVTILTFWSNVHSEEGNVSWKLDAMPRDLEIDFAISALPPHLRSDATVYVLNPKIGYEAAKQGPNGFNCFISRTEWEWEDFRNDHFVPICYDAEGSATILSLYFEVARLRLTGKYTPTEIKNIVIDGFNTGKFKAPSRTGVAYMLAPIMRTYTSPFPDPKNKSVISMRMPHYMFYAPDVKNEEIGGKVFSPYPFIFNPGGRKHGYIIMMAGEMETNNIIKEQKDLLKRLAKFRNYLRVNNRL